MPISPYQAVWLITLFDLPTDTKAARKAASGFRMHLLKNGFTMLQYSVYGRYCPSEEKAQVHRGRIKQALPNDGEVRIITLTDVQFGKMKIFQGKSRGEIEKVPEQISLF